MDELVDRCELYRFLLVTHLKHSGLVLLTLQRVDFFFMCIDVILGQRGSSSRTVSRDE